MKIGFFRALHKLHVFCCYSFTTRNKTITAYLGLAPVSAQSAQIPRFLSIHRYLIYIISIGYRWICVFVYFIRNVKNVKTNDQILRSSKLTYFAKDNERHFNLWKMPIGFLVNKQNTVHILRVFRNPLLLDLCEKVQGFAFLDDLS